MYYIQCVQYMTDFEFSPYLVRFYLRFDFSPLIHTFNNVHLAVYLIWRSDMTVKGAKKNTSPNVICLQYSLALGLTLNKYTLL